MVRQQLKQNDRNSLNGTRDQQICTAGYNKTSTVIRHFMAVQPFKEQLHSALGMEIACSNALYEFMWSCKVVTLNLWKYD